MMKFRLLDTGPLDAARNMALDEVLTRRAGRGQSPPTLRFLQFEPEAALLGYHQLARRELRLDFCRREGIHVNRRLTGGGALLFQRSALGWELIGPMHRGPFAGGFEAALERICRAAARGYSRLGVEARFRPRNDIEVDGRKISGTGGMILEGGALFQGTVLIKNEIERFLRALRVPVEKLKKREIESLMERMAFLEDLLGGPVDLAELKEALAREFCRGLDISLEPGGLSREEERELQERLAYFQSEEWIGLQVGGSGEPAWLKSFLQTDQGSLSVNLWLDRRGRRIQKALISGDFFCRPQRLVRDLEAALMGLPARPREVYRRVEGFLEQSRGGLVGIGAEEVARAAALAAARWELYPAFTPQEAAELFLVNLEPEQVGRIRARWLLLPYCAKPLHCPYRSLARCDQCGDCQFAPLYQLAQEIGLTPVSVQSFEHLMDCLAMVRRQGGAFVGSCCEAFYCKHQMELEASGTRGILVNLDSTTCYDLGKGMEAYLGHFDNQTEMNLELVEKAARIMAGKLGP